MSEIFKLAEWLDDLLKEKHTHKTIKLLNVGSNNHREYHWRFRMPTGEILEIKLEEETETT